VREKERGGSKKERKRGESGRRRGFVLHLFGSYGLVSGVQERTKKRRDRVTDGGGEVREDQAKSVEKKKKREGKLAR
jgi:hypothetical protein